MKMTNFCQRRDVDDGVENVSCQFPFDDGLPTNISAGIEPKFPACIWLLSLSHAGSHAKRRVFFSIPLLLSSKLSPSLVKVHFSNLYACPTLPFDPSDTLRTPSFVSSRATSSSHLSLEIHKVPHADDTVDSQTRKQSNPGVMCREGNEVWYMIWRAEKTTGDPDTADWFKVISEVTRWGYCGRYRLCVRVWHRIQMKGKDDDTECYKLCYWHHNETRRDILMNQ